MKLLFSLSFLLCCGGCARLESSPSFRAPRQSGVYTSTREVRSLTLDSRGNLWAATSGGVLCRDIKGTWTKWTRDDGLPTNEVRDVAEVGEKICVETPRGVVTLVGKRWEVSKNLLAATKTATKTTTWNGFDVEVVTEGLKLKRGSSTRSVRTPGSGTHISAVWARNKTLLAASFGDNVYEWNGRVWRSLNLQVPPAARDITALCEDVRSKTLWIGTRRAGVWRANLSTRSVTPASSHDSEPFDHNAQYLTQFGGRVWISTLEDGLASFNGRRWQHAAPPQISSVAPRQMAVFNDALFVRHGDGQVDKWNGKTWAKNVLSWLPRHKVLALASDENRLVAVQWGGWSEWNGARWTHHFDVAELQNTPIVSLLVDGMTLWLGTQNKGVVEYSNGVVKTYDERYGLPDDWITCFGKVGEIIYAGTFVGGLARFDGEKWTTFSQLAGENVTSLAHDAKGVLSIATRHGTWRLSGNTLHKMDDLEPEAQALFPVKGGVFIGARTGIHFKAISDNDK